MRAVHTIVERVTIVLDSDKESVDIMRDFRLNGYRVTKYNQQTSEDRIKIVAERTLTTIVVGDKKD